MHVLVNYSSGLHHINFQMEEEGTHSAETLTLKEEPPAIELPKQPATELPKQLEALRLRIGDDSEPIFLKLQRILLGKYAEEERRKIEELLQAWSEYQIEDLMEMEEHVGEETHRLYKEVEMLSARVYKKWMDYIKRLRLNREGDQGKANQAFSSLINGEQLEYSYDRHFWQRRIIKSKNILYGSGYKWAVPDKKYSCAEIQLVSKWIQTCQIPLLQKTLKFMTAVELIVLEEEAELHNSYMLKLERIYTHDQRKTFMESMACEAYQQAKVLHSKQFKSNDHQMEAKKTVSHSFPNYYLYKGETDKPWSIALLHSKFQHYEFLQDRHDYIQWMFANHFGSSYNSRSFPLTYVESQLFLDDTEVGRRMLTSIYIFFDFMGIRLALPSLQLSICSLERLEAVILRHHHNHLRIMRILSCLSITGFRPLALSLIAFLDKHTQPGALLEKERQAFESSWDMYGEKQPRMAKYMCFLEDQQYPQEHLILAELKKMEQEQQKVVEGQQQVVIEHFA